MTEYGYCRCGCGEKTRLAPESHSQNGWVKGEPLSYVPGHLSSAQKRWGGAPIKKAKRVKAVREEFDPESGLPMAVIREQQRRLKEEFLQRQARRAA